MLNIVTVNKINWITNDPRLNIIPTSRLNLSPEVGARKASEAIMAIEKTNIDKDNP